MNNWTQRLAIFAVLGAILSSAMLVGCGGSSDEGTSANGAPSGSSSGSSSATSSATKDAEGG